MAIVLRERNPEGKRVMRSLGLLWKMGVQVELKKAGWLVKGYCRVTAWTTRNKQRKRQRRKQSDNYLNI